MEIKEEVYQYLRTIPRGKVVTYGQIGEALGNKHLARAIGNALHVNPDPLGTPCYKVVNAKGHLSSNYIHGIEMQKSRLLDEGIEVDANKVDLNKYQWKEK